MISVSVSLSVTHRTNSKKHFSLISPPADLRTPELEFELRTSMHASNVDFRASTQICNGMDPKKNIMTFTSHAGLPGHFPPRDSAEVLCGMSCRKPTSALRRRRRRDP